ncbi:ankyrin repeat-containing domain protein [Halteromyces radiatus]|uniref:ankyrin repeat-containing domain protein n=1 Tax=Halteromyces radiatus TaxID=101107 RepID=UPI00221F627E|nr:ankyrin repeat-containing domain protein [Halteromyces radiatus]KAI8096259.1 ankyrin repeat-containing domain protein [Halteromyces radiatus]
MIQTNDNKRVRSNSENGTENNKKRQTITNENDDESDSPATTSALWKAITLTSLDMKALYQYIKTKGDLSETNEDGYGLVYLAARNNSMEALRLLLLTSELDVNTIHGPHKELALHAAASAGSFDAVELLLEHGSDVNLKDTLGHTPLSNSLFAKSLPCTQLLIDAGAALDTIDAQGNTLLHLAVSNQFSEVIPIFMERGVPVDQNNHRGLSPLAIAIGLGYGSIMTRLLEGGADVNGKTRFATVLHHAVTWNRMDALEALINGGAEINVTNTMEETPLLVAVQQRKIDMVRYLMEHGADPGYNNGNNNTSTNTPLLYAANHGCTELCTLLVTPETSTYFMQIAADMSERASFTATANYIQSKINERLAIQSTSETTETAASASGTTHPLLSSSSLSSPTPPTAAPLNEETIQSPTDILDTDFSALINSFSDDEEYMTTNNPIQSSTSPDQS